MRSDFILLLAVDHPVRARLREKRRRGLGVYERGPMLLVVEIARPLLERPRDLLAQLQAPVFLAPLCLESLLQEQCGDHDRDEEEEEGHEIWQQERISFEQPAVAEQAGVLLHWPGEEAAEAWSKHRADAPDKRHEGEGFRLQFFPWHHLRYHSSDNTDFVVVLANLIQGTAFSTDRERERETHHFHFRGPSRTAQ